MRSTSPSLPAPALGETPARLHTTVLQPYPLLYSLWRRGSAVPQSRPQACRLQCRSLCACALQALGLRPGTPVGVGMIDAHAGGVGSLGAALPREAGGGEGGGDDEAGARVAALRWTRSDPSRNRPVGRARGAARPHRRRVRRRRRRGALSCDERLLTRRVVGSLQAAPPATRLPVATAWRTGPPLGG